MTDGVAQVAGSRARGGVVEVAPVGGGPVARVHLWAPQMWRFGSLFRNDLAGERESKSSREGVCRFRTAADNNEF